MKARSRVMAALFALSALILFQVEGLWASAACSVELEISVASEVPDTESASPCCPMGELNHSPEDDRKGPEGSACPLMPGGAASCVGGSALLPSSDEPALGPTEDEVSLASSDHAKDLLLAISLLRPPRA